MTERSFAALRAGFEQAKSSRSEGLESSSFCVAGGTVRISAVGYALAQAITRPLAHLATASGPAALTVDVWDAADCRVPPPVVPAAEGPGAVTSSPDGRFLVYERPGSVAVLDRASRHLVGCFESSSRLTLGDRARPLSVPLGVWCGDRDIQLIHAGLVAVGGDGVLLAGPSRAGKSTAALACACAGFDFVGEDFVALSGDLTGHGLFNSSLLDPVHLAGFPPLPPGTIDAGQPADEKRLLFLDGARAAPIRLVALPLIVGSANSRTRPATAGAALRRLAPGSLVKRAVPPRATLRRMAQLVDRVPSYWLELDGELDRIAPRVERMLSEAGRR